MTEPPPFESPPFEPPSFEPPMRPPRPRPRRRRRRPWLRLARLLVPVVALLLGIGLGEALRSSPAKGSQVVVRTLSVQGLAPVPETVVTLTTAVP